MERELTRLGSTRVDVLVVGGGIYGLFVAYDAASRGLSVALVERDDFGGGLSFNHQRTIHGGLRALETGHVSKAREQIEERRAWAVMAPRLVAPLPFLIGTYGFTKRSRLAVGLGFALYNALGDLRNRDLPESLHLPKAHLVSAQAAIDAFPDINRRGLSAGAVWYDYQARLPDRLNTVVAMGARAAGAQLFNYTRAVEPLLGPGGVIGARVRDELSGDEHEILARATVLAGGAASGALLQAFGRTPGPPFVRAMNVLLERPARSMALAAPGRSGRMLTAVPWRGFTLVGTWQSPTVVPQGASDPSAADVDGLLADANVAFPDLRATRADVRILHHGLTPAVVRGGRTDLMPESLVLQPGWPERRGLFGVVGVKFTTARQTAEQVVGAVCHFLGVGNRRASTATARLPHAGPLTDHDRITATPRELAHDPALVREVLDWYGTEADALFSWSRSQGLLERLAPDVPVLSGEVAYAVKFSQAVRLADVVMRRTALGSAGHPGPSALARAADIMGHLLAWPPDTRARELADVEARYRLPDA